MAAYLKLVLSESDVNKKNNTSKVTAKLYYYGNGVSYNANSPSGSITIDGTAYSFSHSFTTSTSAQLLATKTKTVTHNSNGKKTVSVSAKFKTGVTLGTLETSGSITLTTIARTSTLSISKMSIPADGNTTMTATATKQSSSFTDTIIVTLGSYSMTVTSGTAFTIPMEWINAIPETSATATVKVTTKSGSTTVGTATKSLTVTVPDSVVPVVNSISVSEAVSKVTTAFGNRFVKGLSQLNVTINASGVYGSTIRSYSTTIDGITYIQQAFTSNVITTAGTLAIKTKVTDSRGRTAEFTQSVSVIDYMPPAITYFVHSISGTTATFTISYKVYPVDNQNSKSLKLLYKKATDTGYTPQTISISDYEGNATASVTGISSDTTYEFKVEITDKITTGSAEIKTGKTVLSLLAGGKGAAFFGEAEKEGLLVNGSLDVVGNANMVKQYDLNGININDTAGSWTVDISDSSHGTVPEVWVNVTQTTSGHFLTQIANKCNGSTSATGRSNRVWVRDKYVSQAWSNWSELITPSAPEKVLWNGVSFMYSSLTITLSEAISAQPRGIVLVFSHYDYSGGTVHDYSWAFHFVPKWFVSAYSGKGCDFVYTTSGDSLQRKYLYISDTTIKGHDLNSNQSYKLNGLSIDQTDSVLRYVIGV